MVYCGKPSTGCQTCRIRKIKCDEKRPACGQCIKSRRSCSGYRDAFDVMFRDETHPTQQRASRTGRTPAKQKARDACPLTLSQLIPNAITTSVEAQADCYFITNFVLLPEKRINGAFHEYILPLLRLEGSGGPFRYAFNACALAFFNNRSEVRSKFTTETTSYYAKALESVNDALRDPVSQTADATLAAVLMLGLLENITAEPLNKLAWGSHVRGASEMVHQRGRQQFRTKTGCQLFAAVRMQMIVHYLTLSDPPPLDVDWWMTNNIRSKPTSDCQHLVMKVGMLRAEIMRLISCMAHTPDSTQVMFDALRKCQTVDQETANWMAMVPEYWRYATISLPDNLHNCSPNSEVYAGRVDMYRDSYIASVWNLARAARLILGSLIIRSIAWIYPSTDYRVTPEYLTTLSHSTRMVSDIIASVPQCLGWHLRNRHILREANLDHYNSEGAKGVKSSHGYFLRWPLSCVHHQDCTTEDQRAWVIARLRYIGDELGIKSSHKLADSSFRFPSMIVQHDKLKAAIKAAGKTV